MFASEFCVLQQGTIFPSPTLRAKGFLQKIASFIVDQCVRHGKLKRI